MTAPVRSWAQDPNPSKSLNSCLRLVIFAPGVLGCVPQDGEQSSDVRDEAVLQRGRLSTREAVYL